MSRTIRISDNTVAKLSSYGMFGDTFDAVINKVISIAEQHAKTVCEEKA